MQLKHALQDLTIKYNAVLLLQTQTERVRNQQLDKVQLDKVQLEDAWTLEKKLMEGQVASLLEQLESNKKLNEGLLLAI